VQSGTVSMRATRSSEIRHPKAARRRSSTHGPNRTRQVHPPTRSRRRPAGTPAQGSPPTSRPKSSTVCGARPAPTPEADSGIDLAVTKEPANARASTATADSGPGGGTRMTLRLPRGTTPESRVTGHGDR
jgi:hypothetical protein